MTVSINAAQAVAALKAHGVRVISSTHGKPEAESIVVEAVYCRDGQAFDVVETIKPAHVAAWLGY